MNHLKISLPKRYTQSIWVSPGCYLFCSTIFERNRNIYSILSTYTMPPNFYKDKHKVIFDDIQFKNRITSWIERNKRKNEEKKKSTSTHSEILCAHRWIFIHVTYTNFGHAYHHPNFAPFTHLIFFFFSFYSFFF